MGAPLSIMAVAARLVEDLAAAHSGNRMLKENDKNDVT